MTPHTLRCADGQTLQASLYAPATPKAAIVIAPGLGIPRRFYGKLAEFLERQDIAALCFDYRGTADSKLEVGSPRELRINDWGEKDLDAALREARRCWPQAPLFLLGHSLGNQLCGMAASSRELTGFVMTAAPAPHWRHYRGWQRGALWFWFKVMVPLASAGRDMFPARALGFSGMDVPTGPFLQWARAAGTDGYLFHPQFGLDMDRFHALALPTLAWQFRDDSYVPRESHENLLRAYPNLKLERRELAPADIGVKRIGHLGYFTPACEPLWRQTADWIHANAAA